MPIEIETCEGLLVVSDQEIRAVVRHAKRAAELTAAALDATGLFPEKPISLPAAFLLEFAAVLELGLWERQGLREFLKTDLPSYSEAAEAMLAKAKLGPAAFGGPDDASSLSSRVLQAWIRHCTGKGPISCTPTSFWAMSMKISLRRCWPTSFGSTGMNCPRCSTINN